MAVSTCELYLYQEIYRASRQFPFFGWVEASVTWHTGLSQWRPLFVDSRRLIARSQNRSRMCEIRLTKLLSGWVLRISMQWLRLKGCHVACDGYASGEICSLQHMWVTGSVMGAVASVASLKFGVQGASATNWFSRDNGARDKGIRDWLILIVISEMSSRLYRTTAIIHNATCLTFFRSRLPS